MRDAVWLGGSQGLVHWQPYPGKQTKSWDLERHLIKWVQSAPELVQQAERYTG